MARFPTLPTGAVTQYPTTVESQYRTTILQYVGGREQRFMSSALVRRWRIVLADVPDTDIAVLEHFFETQQGRFGTFVFTDPHDGAEYPDCSFDGDLMDATLFGEGRSRAVLIIRTHRG